MIKNVIFDLGVVLLDVDYGKTIDAFGQLGLENPQEAFSKQSQEQFFRDYERGLVTDKNFLNELSNRTNGAAHSDLKNAWCAMLGELPREKYDLIQNLRGYYRLFVLSNTNGIHQTWFEKKIDDQYGWTNFSDCFEYIGYSHEIHERKPLPGAFQHLLREFELDPSKTVFVDDTLEHVDGAKKLHIEAVHYQEGQNLAECLSALPHFDTPTSF